ncbi:MAG: sigma-54 dependent transcriptional regulator [Myxococcales bacterium]
MSAHVLVADDETLIRQSIEAALAEEGFAVRSAASGAEAWSRFQEDRPDVVLLDLVLGDMDGLELLRRMRQASAEVKIILISAHGSIETAVTAMKLGGYDFIRKPFDLEEIVATVRNAARTSSLEQRVAYLSAQERKRSATMSFVHGSPRMSQILREVAVIAASPVPTVLITGDSGTGKQAIARMLHDGSSRSGGPFVELNCSAIPENLVESELFGHERGAFSDARERKLGLVEIADGGTLFLDEVGDLGGPAQAKLLTFLEQRTFRRVGATSVRRVDARVVAATNRNLSDMMSARTFREDLFYRLNAITIQVPPLRDRPEDIPVLAQYFLAECAHELGRHFSTLAPETTGLLERYRWPGNVRELRAVISRAVLLHDDTVLKPGHLPGQLIADALADAPLGMADGGRPSQIPTLEAIELAHIRRVLDVCGGNRTLAAQHLGITRQTLSKRLGGTGDDRE